MFWRKFLVLALFSAVLAACGGGSNAGDGPTAAAVGDPTAGEALFKQATIGDAAPGCITCHSLEAGQVVVGPSLAGVASRAGEQVAGQTAEEYLRNSILDPNAFIVKGYSVNGMYQDFGDVLTEQQVNDLVAYLLTLK